MRAVWKWGTCGWLAVSGLGLACGPGLPKEMVKPPDYDPKGVTKCSVTKSQAKPLIVEWPTADRLALEIRSRRGVVAVRYIGCEMKVLEHCEVPAKYNYLAATRQDDNLKITDEDALYANIPVYAAKFEAKLAAAGQLNVTMSMVGRYVADDVTIDVSELDGACEGATHLVAGLTVGAFEFSAGAQAEAGAGAEVGNAGIGIKKASTHETLNRAGKTVSCDSSTDSDDKPPSGCGAVIRVEVLPLKGVVAVAQPSSQPGGTGEGETPAPASGDRDGDGWSDAEDKCPEVKGSDDGCPKVVACNKRGKRCSSYSDCCPDESCVEDCGSGARAISTPYLAQAEEAPSCPRRCVADDEGEGEEYE